MASKSLLATPPSKQRSPLKSKDSVEIVQEWDKKFDRTFNTIKDDLQQLNKYADELILSRELENAIYTVLDDVKINDKLLESICKWIFAYRSTKCEKLHRYVLNYVPSLMCLMFQASVMPIGARKKFKCAETCILNIYNKEIVDEEGKPKKVTMRIPDLSKPSIYHNTPLSTSPGPSNLTEQTLKFLEATLPDKPIPTFGPYEQVEKLNASNRSKTMTVLVRVYYQNLNYVSKSSWKIMCRVTLKLLKNSGPRSPAESAHAISLAKAAVAAAEKTPSGVLSFDEMLAVGVARIQIESPWFVEVLRCIYVFLYNGLTDQGTKVLQLIHKRATVELWTDVMLLSNAMVHSFKIDPNPSAADAEPDLHGSRSDVRSPISTILTATASNKTPTTAATFKPSKLPEDIPIVHDPPSEASTTLDTEPSSSCTLSLSSRPTSSMKD